MRIFAALLALLAWLAVAPDTHAHTPQGMEIHVHAGLEAETLTPAPGSTVTLAITMRPDPGWHDYWLNPGDAGLSLTLDWQLPPGASAGPPRFPVPEPLVLLGLMNYAYERPHAMLVDLKLPDGLAAGTKIPVIVNAEWMACSDRLCVPQEGRLALQLTIGDGKIAATDRERFDTWRAALPVPIESEARYAISGKVISIAIPYPANATLAEPYFFPETLGLFDYMAPQPARRVGNWLVVESRVSKSYTSNPPKNIKGLLRIGSEQGLLVSAKAGAIPEGGVTVTSAAQAPPIPALHWLLLGALVGGLLLNIMPCVFPILGLKALALAKAGGDEREARADALAYSAGVVLSCIALGGIMLALRAGGEEIGWAFQLQDPGFVLFLLLLMVGITANLLGLFELGGFDVGDALTRKPGLVGSFWTGVLAALVATPCTGPFMAAALGASLLLPTAQALGLFAALGIGIALPFLAIAYIPALRNRLPKPGPWLGAFRKAMAVPMGLTAAALLWLLWRTTGGMGLLIGLAASAAILAVFILQYPKSLSMRNVGVAQLMGALLVFGLAVKWLPTEAPASFAKNVLNAEPFAESRLATLRAEGKPVFVYFTADWCVTCKVNEAAVLERSETMKLFADKGVTVLRGDFTRRDPAIARFLASHGHAGVPLYLFYPKGGEAKVLPQLLTYGIIEDAAGG
jgi:thiol:disulfide interchange protein